MTHGGSRPGAGRPVGSRNRTEGERAAAVLGQSPLDYMLAVMNDPAADASRRDQMAVAAAPFVHPLARRDLPRSPHDQFMPRGARSDD